jgi:hypothetical protein
VSRSHTRAGAASAAGAANAAAATPMSTTAIAVLTGRLVLMLVRTR